MRSRRTRQLEAVRRVLAASRDHPTAAQVHARVRKLLPRISLGTVYRNLQKLVATGQAMSVRLGDGAAHFDGVATEHDHFVCQACGRIIDLQAAAEPAVDTTGLQRAGFAVRGHRLAVVGFCRECARKGRVRRQGAAGPG